MINSIYVPVIINDKDELFEVTVCENNCKDSCLTMEGEVVPRYERIFKKKIPEMNCNIGFNSFEGNKILEDFSNATYSITLGTFIAIKIFTYKLVFKNQYTGIVITGNLAEGNDYLCVVDDIEKKYKAATKLLKTSDDKILFIYVSDVDFDLKNSDAVHIKRFSSYDTLDTIFDFLFVSRTVEIDYDPLGKTYSLSGKRIIHNLVCEQIENRSISIDMQSLTVKINLDDKKFPKNHCPEIMEVYNQANQKKRLLKNCIQLLFSKEFKTLYSAMTIDYEAVLKSLFDLILLGKEYIHKDNIHIDALSKSSKGDLLLKVPMDRKDYEKVIKKNMFFPFFPEEENWHRVMELIPKGRPLFSLIELPIALGWEWGTKYLIPTLLARCAFWIENKKLSFDEITANTILDVDKWNVMG